MTGTVLGKAATLSTHGTSIRLKVSGFVSQATCPSLCFGLCYMSLQAPIAIRIRLTPQDVVFSADPSQASKNLSSSTGGGKFGEQVHGIMQEGAPAIYPTDQRVVMLSGGEVSFVITGLAKPEQALQWIAEGAALAGSTQAIPDEVALAIELFNLSGFEPSPRAAFIVHCTALEQMFRPVPVDPKTLDHINRIIANLDRLGTEAESDEERHCLRRLTGRLGNLKKYSITRSVQEGVAKVLAPGDEPRAKAIVEELGNIYRVRNTLAHAGRADLGDAPRCLQHLLKQIIMAKLGKPAPG